MRIRNKLLIILVLAISLLLFSINSFAEMYYLEDECIIFVKSDEIIYFSILDGKIIGGYIIVTDISKITAINQQVKRSYYDEETGITQIEFQTQIVILDIALGVETIVIPFGNSKVGIGVYFDLSSGNS